MEATDFLPRCLSALRHQRLLDMRKIFHNYALMFFSLCFLLLIVLPAQAQIDGKIVYPASYTYHAGDDST